ncbi:MAG: ketoacyl-ACP synthase III [Alphaproteobacteria bacterium]|nr:ketoacyl-ACP synthase III [Alphaproteobacteria bacterium]MCB9794487.1 ketoacyl-ACP synthase III [Alphaproteobacteria bacterium]
MSLSLLGVGHALPERVVPSAEVERAAGFPEGWAEKHVGIAERRVCGPEELSGQLGARAARAALEAAGVGVDALDLLVVHSSCPEVYYPDPAWFIAAELGLAPEARVLGLRAQCAGFIAALDVCAQYLASGAATRALVVCAERMFRPAQGYDRAALLFGDGAAAVVLGPGRALRHLSLRNTPAHADRCLLATPALEREAWDTLNPELAGHWSGGEREVPASGQVGFWEGGHIFRSAVEGMGEGTLQALRATGLGVDEIDHFLYHQANAKILRSLVRYYELPEARVRSNVRRVGNISSATVPLLLSEGIAAGEIRPGQRLLLGAFGAGYVTGTAILEL